MLDRVKSTSTVRRGIDQAVDDLLPEARFLRQMEEHGRLLLLAAIVFRAASGGACGVLQHVLNSRCHVAVDWSLLDEITVVPVGRREKGNSSIGNREVADHFDHRSALRTRRLHDDR